MARSFTRANNEYLHVATAAVLDYPFAMGCMFRTNGIDTTYTLMSIGRSDDAGHWTGLSARGSQAGDPVRVFSHQYGDIEVAHDADTSSGFTANIWHHAICVLGGISDRRVYIDGGSEGLDTGTVGAIDHTPGFTAIGANRDLTPGGYFDGAIAESAFWDLSLWPGATDTLRADEFVRLAVPSLGAQFSPLFFPLGLVNHWSLGGVYDANDGDHDIVGTLDMTAFSDGAGPGVADHPPGMIYPSRAMGQFIEAAAPTGFVPSRVIGRGILQGVYG